ncbi:MAG: hypothetical protein JWR18_862 [Segetibacter sp.]|jgi:hypothetical protein|nr:hypothetical protein [Segetibacter sp.]
MVAKGAELFAFILTVLDKSYKLLASSCKLLKKATKVAMKRSVQVSDTTGDAQITNAGKLKIAYFSFNQLEICFDIFSYSIKKPSWPYEESISR